MTPTEILESAAVGARVREGAEGVRAVLRAVHVAGTIATRDLAQSARLPLPVVAAIRGELAKLDVIEKRPSGAGLTPRGQQLADEMFGESASVPNAAHSSPDAPTDLLARVRDFTSQRPDADTTLDQAKATPETLVRRVAYLASHDALTGRRVLCLGDDDFVTGAIVAWTQLESDAGRKANPDRLCALDIDPRIVSALAARDGVEAHVWDARDPVPDDLRGAFDVVVTDPPYTLPGTELFLSRAAEAVGARPGTRCYFSFGHVAPQDMRDIQAAMLDIGWIVSEWTPAFNEYEGGGLIAGTSLLAELVLAPDAESIVPGHYEGDLYTSDVRPAISTYRCRECGALCAVGPGAPISTIADLKRAGCSECGADRFVRTGRRTGGEQASAQDSAS